MDDIGTRATCGSGDWDTDGYKLRCDDPAPYRAEYNAIGFDGGRGSDAIVIGSYSVPVCVRHAHDARTHDSLKRIYSARAAD